MEEVRTFVAIELGGGMAERLAEVQNLLRRQISGVRWVHPSSIHLTLKFLGVVAVQRVSEIEAAVARAAVEARSFQVDFQGLGCFPNTRSPSVIWVGVGGELEPLRRLQGRVEEELEGIGFAREDRAFSPHLTLGRVAKTAVGAERRSLGDVVAKAPVERLGEIQVEAISLMRSQLTPSGALHSRLALCPFGQST